MNGLQPATQQKFVSILWILWCGEPIVTALWCIGCTRGGVHHEVVEPSGYKRLVSRSIVLVHCLQLFKRISKAKLSLRIPPGEIRHTLHLSVYIDLSPQYAYHFYSCCLPRFHVDERLRHVHKLRWIPSLRYSQRWFV